MKYRKVIADMTLNIVSSAIPTFVLQLLILPDIANYMTDNQYGLFVTILALLNVVSSTFGNALNNVRLISNEKLQGKVTSYNCVLLLLSVLNFFIVAVFYIFYESEYSLINLALTIIVSLVWLWHEYFIVAFRLVIDYKKILLSNIILVIGYFIGYFFYRISGYWQFIYLIGHTASLMFIFANCSLWKEGLRKDSNFYYLTRETGLLSGSNVLSRVTTYADKLLIFPILGGTSVSVYYAATLFGKVVSLAITPISSVMLTYLAKLNKKNDNLFIMTTVSGSVVCVFGYIFCLLITKPVLSLLYPRFVDAAMPYITITTATMVLTSLISLINPFVLNFFSMKWQIIINSIYVAVYISLSMSMLHVWGLYGFCIGSLIATLCKLLSIFYIYFKTNTKLEKLKS